MPGLSANVEEFPMDGAHGVGEAHVNTAGSWYTCTAALRSDEPFCEPFRAATPREAEMADTTTPAPTGGRALFVRQSSGLVREVSVRNALFYNTAAFIGITVAWASVFYTLAFVPIGKKFGLTSYGWTAILVGICCVFL